MRKLMLASSSDHQSRLPDDANNNFCYFSEYTNAQFCIMFWLEEIYDIFHETEGFNRKDILDIIAVIMQRSSGEAIRKPYQKWLNERYAEEVETEAKEVTVFFKK